jgi:hypothetical protein
LILYFILFAVSVGFIAGFFPALFFARVNAIQVLKNISSEGKIEQMIPVKNNLP